MDDTRRKYLAVMANMCAMNRAGGPCLVEVAWHGPDDRIELHYLPVSSEMLDIFHIPTSRLERQMSTRRTCISALILKRDTNVAKATWDSTTEPFVQIVQGTMVAILELHSLGRDRGRARARCSRLPRYILASPYFR